MGELVGINLNGPKIGADLQADPAVGFFEAREDDFLKVFGEGHASV